MVSRPSNLLFSYSAQIVIFTTVIVLITIVSLYYLGRHLEGRIISLVEEHIQEVSLAVDLAQTSFPSGQYLYELVPEDGRLSVGLDESHIIHRILVADADGRILDSVERGDLGRTLDEVLGDLSPQKQAVTKGAASTAEHEPDKVLSYPIETEKGIRRVVIIISPHHLAEVVRKESRERLIAIGLLGLLLIAIIAVASWRFTRPIKELTDAALKVSSGDFNFEVPVVRRDEVGILARTFNEMLAGLRTKQELEEKLQRAERSVLTGRIAVGIAHEIRNPLSFINLTIDYMRDKFAPSAEISRADYNKLCDTIKEELARLNRMASDFLSYGRPARLNRLDIDTRAVVEEVIDLMRAKSEQQGVVLTVKEMAGDHGQEHDARIRGDAEQLKTCFSNLAINAFEAMPQGSSLTITLHPQKNNVRIEFGDTGHGITPEALGQIFEPYFSTKATGTGLGLALTKKLIEDHGGQISVESEVGVGTIFRVTLPREPITNHQYVPLLQTALNTA